MEIEKKWIIDKFPENEPYQILHVNQGYISINPEVRIREAKVIRGEDEGYVDYTLAVKGSGDIAREEIEHEISKDFYDKLVKFINKPMIEKDYRRYHYDGKMVEISHVDPKSNNNFYYAEIEFDTIEEAMNYKYPFNNIIMEVTFNDSYKMKNYWKKTRLNNEGE